jgi:hypothetical protein
VRQPTSPRQRRLALLQGSLRIPQQPQDPRLEGEAKGAGIIENGIGAALERLIEGTALREVP